MNRNFVTKVQAVEEGKLIKGFFNKMQEFEAYLYDEGKSEKTIEAYVRDMRLFNEYIESMKDPKVSLNDLVRSVVQDYITHLETVAKQSVATVERKFNSIRAFCEYSDQMNAVNKIRRIKKQRTQSEDFDMLDRLELKAVLRTVERTHNPKAKALIFLLAYTGIRIEEAEDILTEHLDFSKGGGLTIVGKGRKMRTTIFPSEAKIAVEEYLATRNDDCPSLFVNDRKTKAPLSKRGLQRIVEEVRAIHQATGGVHKDLHFSAHTFRHSFARTMLVELQKDPVTVAEWMGHSSIEITRQYARSSTRQQREETEDFVI